MSRPVRVRFLPTLVQPDDVDGSVAVVIDILRASTTIVHSLAAGAKRVIPCAEVQEARDVATRLDNESVVLGGERGGERITGFDLDNSPLAYTPDSAGGRTVVFTTTNGTRAVLSVRDANRALIGCFVNQRAIIEALAADDRPVLLVCAGTNGAVTSEDVLFAGAVADGLCERADYELDDETRLAMDFFQANSENHARLLSVVRSSRGGRNLVRLGFDEDIERAVSIDLFRCVPEFLAATNQICDSVSHNGHR